MMQFERKDNFMNKNIEDLLQELDFCQFLKLIELGIIDKKLGTEEVIKAKNSRCIYEFATSVKGVDVAKLQDAIIATENPHYIYFFAKDVDGADMEKMTNAIIET